MRLETLAILIRIIAKHVRRLEQASDDVPGKVVGLVLNLLCSIRS